MKILLSLCQILLLSWTAMGANIQVDYSAAPGQRNVQNLPLATAIPDGNKVAVGTFAGGFDVVGNAGSISALAANWIEFDSKSTRTIGGEPGRFAESKTGDDALFNGKPIYLWIFKTETNTDPASFPGGPFDDVRGYGLFTAPAWIFPSGSNPAPANFIEITSDDAGITALNGVVFGPVDTGALQFVPEPGAGLLLGIGLLLMAGCRRRS